MPKFLMIRANGQKRTQVANFILCDAHGPLATQALREYFGTRRDHWLPSGEAPEKYSHVIIQGIEFKPGEPWFIIRGQDRTSVGAINAYIQLLGSVMGAGYAPVLAARKFLKRLKDWQKANPQWLKEPD